MSLEAVLAHRRAAAIRRFWSNVDRDGPAPANAPDLGPCWLWTRCKRGASGYGCVKIDGKVHDAHRLAWTLTHGELESRAVLVCHKCDVRLCCNPAHLFLGSYTDNNADMTAKGRRATSEQLSIGQRVRRNAGIMPNQKLTIELVAALRETWATGAYDQGEIGIMYGIDRSTVGKIVRGETWRDGPRVDGSLALEGHR